jgi:hypothetical protein
MKSDSDCSLGCGTAPFGRGSVSGFEDGAEGVNMGLRPTNGDEEHADGGGVGDLVARLPHRVFQGSGNGCLLQRREFR